MEQSVPLYQVDSFTGKLFAGNPAAVCLLKDWPDDALMQSIAAENNLSETAFFNPNGKELTLRWFTPSSEIDLCGHATLATAAVLFRNNGEVPALTFLTRSGELTVRRNGERLTMNFPAWRAEPVTAPASLTQGLGVHTGEVFKARDYMVVFDSEEQVRSLEPDFAALAAVDAVGVIVTAPGKDCDFVSRFFAPRVGVPEDPVTGSAHCTLTPFWAERLGKSSLHAHQLSKRGGELWCEEIGERVEISGQARCFFEGICHLA